LSPVFHGFTPTAIVVTHFPWVSPTAIFVEPFHGSDDFCFERFDGFLSVVIVITHCHGFSRTAIVVTHFPWVSPTATVVEPFHGSDDFF